MNNDWCIFARRIDKELAVSAIINLSFQGLNGKNDDLFFRHVIDANSFGFLLNRHLKSLKKINLIAIRDSKQFVDGFTNTSRTLIGILAHDFLMAHLSVLTQFVR